MPPIVPVLAAALLAAAGTRLAAHGLRWSRDLPHGPLRTSVRCRSWSLLALVLSLSIGVLADAGIAEALVVPATITACAAAVATLYFMRAYLRLEHLVPDTRASDSGAGGAHGA